MKRVLAVVACLSLSAPLPAVAGETPIGAGCTITATNPSTGSSASDADCVWPASAILTLQCDVAVYYTRDGSTPTTSSPLVSVGDPYRIRAASYTRSAPIQILPVSGTANCKVFRSDE